MLIAGLVIAAGCTSADPTGPADAAVEIDDDSPDPRDAGRRAVVVATTGCGSAPGGEGSGVALAPTRILTAAHVVAGATEVTVRLRGEVPIDRSIGTAETTGDAAGPDATPALRTVEATVVAYDTRRDLALLDLDGDGVAAPAGPVPIRDLGTGDAGIIIGAGVSGDIPFTVAERTIIEIDEVRGTDRVRRAGYLLEAATSPGDSGSGLYDGRGYLVGVLFAVSTDNGRRSWATAGDEVDAFITDLDVRGDFACDPDRSRLAPIGP
ncbi:MAG: trypsin-like peptidase domain-containing protein [Actinomycetota bacterium]